MLVLTVKLGDKVLVGNVILRVNKIGKAGGLVITYGNDQVYALAPNHICHIGANTTIMYKQAKGKIRLSFDSPHKILRESLLKEET